MEFPKKISKHYKEGEHPEKIIRCCGEIPCIKIMEYVLVKSTGNLFVYKRR